MNGNGQNHLIHTLTQIDMHDFYKFQSLSKLHI